ncbi:MAG: GNAT family protein [Clostridiales bacterium]|nr:GNAT family protein [Clostridiales bacterium]
MSIQLRALNQENWLEAAALSVSAQQKEVFPIPNVYWIGISRYEEHTTLYAIMQDETMVGLIGLGYDEDGVSGYINPLMIDERYQNNHYAEQAMMIAMQMLKNDDHASTVHLGHRKTNLGAGRLYEKLGFEIVGEDEQDYFRARAL